MATATADRFVMVWQDATGTQHEQRWDLAAIPEYAPVSLLTWALTTEGVMLVAAYTTLEW